MSEPTGLDPQPTVCKVLHPAMPLSGPPEGAGAVWVGSCDVTDLRKAQLGDRWRLGEAQGFQWARLLIREGAAVWGFVSVPIIHDVPGGAEAAFLPVIDPREVARKTEGWSPLPLDAAFTERYQGHVSVIIPTRDRPDHLRICLRSILALQDSDFEVIVVDNGSKGRGTFDVIEELNDSRVRCISEPIAGVSRARNRGALEAAGEILAFTDDDVSVDPLWLAGVRRGFARVAGVGCVTGLVPAGELRTSTQRWFESRVTWGRLLTRKIYRLSDPPTDMPLFPFQVGAYGTGANMAVRRSAYLGIGGMDEVLGAGKLPKGGEDLDLFLRVILAGHALVMEPDALVWHRHRASKKDLDSQVVGYGRGLGALMAKVVTHRETLPLFWRRLPQAARRLRALGAVEESDTGDARMADRPLDARGMKRLAHKEFLCLLTGPLYYFRSKREDSSRAPLLPGSGTHRSHLPR